MKLRREDGAAAVEFALVLPILIVLVFGIIEFGFALYNKEVITNASREGARYGIVIGPPRPDEIAIRGVVTSYLTNFGWDLSLAGISVDNDTTGDTQCTAFGEDLKVGVTYQYKFLVLPNFAPIGKDIILRATTEMKCE
jgi:Flp pilus assembly protein TadG